MLYDRGSGEGIVSKYSEIADIIRSEISKGLYSSTGKLPTEFELSQRFGVSRQTIRQAIASLKNDGDVYQIQGSGTYVSVEEKARQIRAKSAFKNVFILCTYISEYIFPSIVRGITSTLTGGGYRVNIAETVDNVEVERKMLMTIFQKGECDGLIVEGTKTSFPNPNVSLYQELERRGVPIVFLHCAYPELSNAVVVGMDDREGGRIAARRLINSGCRKIFGLFKADDRQGPLRYAGFADEVIESGLGLENSDVRWYTTEDMIDYGMSLSQDVVESLAQKNFDGIVCYNDMVATIIVRDFSRYGVAIPKLESFDGSLLGKTSPIRFESLGHRKEELGILAAKKMMNMLDGRKEHSEFLPWII